MRATLTMGEKTIGWWQVLNPAIYLISFLPGLAVFLFTGADLWPLVGATFGVVLIQHGINLLNDAMDWVRGADVEKYNSWVRFHGQLPKRAIWHGRVTLLLGIALGSWVLYRQNSLYVLGLGLPLLALGYGYNAGSRPFAYSAFSEWVTGACYGPGVFGCLWLLSGDRNLGIGISGSVAFAALAVAVLLSHQPSQVLTDVMVGKKSFAVRFGVAKTIQVTAGLFLLSLFALDAAYSVARPPLGFAAFVSTPILFLVLLQARGWLPKNLLLATFAKLWALALLTLLGGVR
ncbi:MAG: UbiA family prenyltransferase [Bdellovibrionales bacterium]|nr:UbiA family prenyltransferase [Bdellovibrionales bacterium]